MDKFLMNLINNEKRLGANATQILNKIMNSSLEIDPETIDKPLENIENEWNKFYSSLESEPCYEYDSDIFYQIMGIFLGDLRVERFVISGRGKHSVNEPLLKTDIIIRVRKFQKERGFLPSIDQIDSIYMEISSLTEKMVALKDNIKFSIETFLDDYETQFELTTINNPIALCSGDSKPTFKLTINFIEYIISKLKKQFPEINIINYPIDISL